MQGRTPRKPIRDPVAEDAAAQTETMPAAGFGYLPARFRAKPRADESVDPIPTF